MGCFCDGCYILYGSLISPHNLKPLDRFDLCPKCMGKVLDGILKTLTTITKGNYIQGRKPN